MLSDQVQHNLDVSNRNIELHLRVQVDAYKTINNIIFVVGTGTLVLSISFIGNIDSVIYFPWLLIASWCFLICSIAGNVVAHVITIKATSRNITLLNEWRSGNIADAMDFEMKKESDPELNRIKRVIAYLNPAVFIFLAAGMVFLVIFGAANLLAQNEVRKILNQQDIHPVVNEHLKD